MEFYQAMRLRHLKKRQLVLNSLCVTNIGKMGANRPSNIPGVPRPPMNIPGMTGGSRTSPSAGRPGPVPGGVRSGGIPGGPGNSSGYQGGGQANLPNPTKRHLLVNLSVVLLGVFFLTGLAMTPYGELFRATSGKSIVIGLVAFFASTVLHALYTFDEDSSKSDGSYSEWNFVPRHVAEKFLLIGCWAIGVVNLASMMTEIARSFS